MRRFTFALSLLSLCTAHAHAGTIITASMSITASGSLDGTSFTDKLVTITGSGDSDNRALKGSDWYLPLTSITVTIAGVGTYAFTDTTWNLVSYPTYLVLHFADLNLNGGNVNATPWAIKDQNQAGYDLSGAIPSVSGKVFGLSEATFPTTGGALELTSFSGATGSASATAATPEPASLMLLGIGALGLGGASWRRRIRGVPL